MVKNTLEKMIIDPQAQKKETNLSKVATGVPTRVKPAPNKTINRQFPQNKLYQ